MTRKYIGELGDCIGNEVTIFGWINSRRDQGKMVFFDIRDISGLVQCIILPKSDVIEVAKNLREECTVEIGGIVKERPQKDSKNEAINGNIEVEVKSLIVLNTAEVLPFSIHEDTKIINESLRLKYRYIDLRSERMHKNIINRFLVQNFVRQYLAKAGFIEIETPLLSAPTPEGSRSFIVPHRIYKGLFYSLPQSPQQYKQLLMTSGFEKYFQFARCLRDEDPRGDRQPEFTQLDMELAFVDEEHIIRLNESILIELVKSLYPNKVIQQIPFPRMSYADVMDKFGSDHPDVREDKSDSNLLAFLWIVDFPMFEKTGADNVDNSGEWTYTHNPFSKPKQEHMEMFMKKENIDKILTTQYDIVLNGFEIGGGSIRNHRPEALKNTFEIMGYSSDRISKNFGHMLDALSYGAPPHGGIAWGFDRLMMILENEENIREVIPFAKTGDGKDLIMQAPSHVDPKQLSELAINIRE